MWCFNKVLVGLFVLVTLTLPALAQVGAYPSGVTTLNPIVVPPNSMVPYAPFGALPAFVPPNPYVATDQSGNAYFAVNPYIPNNPIVATPIVPNPPVRTPVLPNLNVIPNGPMSPGFVMPGPVVPNPVVAGPGGLSIWAPAR